MKKRILSTLMALCLALTLWPAAAFAEEDAAPAVLTVETPATDPQETPENEPEDIPEENPENAPANDPESDLQDAPALLAAAQNGDPTAASMPTGTPLTQALLGTWLEKEDPNNPNSGKVYKMPAGNYYLAEDICLVGDDTDPNSAWPLLISKGAVTLDLNGHVLDLRGKNISIFASLTLTDSNQNAEHKFRVEDSGLWVLDETQGTETVTGGVITGGTGVDSSGGTGTLGGGVNVGGSATFNMNDGSIVGCTANNGGGVSVYSGSFTMTGGRIAGCTAVKSGNAYGNGGGVFVDANGSFTMNGGAIRDCTADIGGGVYVGNSATFTMNDGSIVGCTADIGGGVYMGGSATFTMNDGSIADCAANAVHADGSFADTNSKIDKSLVSGINAGHTGSETDPILIGSAAGLEDFRNKVNGGATTLCATLLCDIVLNDGTFDADGTYTGANGSTSAEPWTPIGTGSYPYTGTFDGGGHTIKGLYINRDESGIGLFGIVSNATIKNLTVTGYVKGYGSVGGIVGGILEEGNVTIQNCANYCEVTGDTYVGGIVGYIGYNAKGDIRNCANFGTVKGTCTDSSAYVGGIVGYASIGQKMTVVCTACYNVGTVKAKKCAGGLLGYGSMKMDSCYNVGLVEGEELIGGLVGDALWLIIDGNGMSLVTVDNCYYLDTATKAFGEARFFAGDTSAWRKSKAQFANELLPLLQNGDTDSPWTKTGYLAAAGMTLPLLSWQTADAHDHTGGTATCKDKAICEICGESYGELNANNHTAMKHIDAKAATTAAEGNIEYWYCEGCGKYFADEGMEKEISKDDTVIPKLTQRYYYYTPTTTDTKKPSPKTADESNMALWCALLLCSGGAAAAVSLRRRRTR